MFWIGFCVGVSASFLVCMVGISAMGWRVAKDRKIAPELVAYWEKAHMNQDAQNQRLSKILEKLVENDNTKRNKRPV